MGKLPEYEIKKKVNLDPGTARFNILYPGGKFELVQRNVGWVRFNYTDYGKFTHKVDFLDAKTFDRLVKDGTFKILEVENE